MPSEQPSISALITQQADIQRQIAVLTLPLTDELLEIFEENSFSELASQLRTICEQLAPGMIREQTTNLVTVLEVVPNLISSARAELASQIESQSPVIEMPPA